MSKQNRDISKSGWAVLDKGWERLQKKTFTKWVNRQLAERELHVEDLATDFDDGVLLIHLIECISEMSLGKFYEKPNNPMRKIENINKGLDFIKKLTREAGIKVEYHAESILNHEQTPILGMIWVLIHKYSIAEISEEQKTAREGLMLWCQKNTQNYDNVSVRDFHKSWKSGLAFCALIHRHKPSALNYSSLKPENDRENLELAFRVASDEFGIPSFLDAEDIFRSDRPDEKSIMTQISYYWKAFASGHKSKIAADRLQMMMKRLRSNDSMIQDYTKRATELVEWMDAKKTEYEEPQPCESMAEIQKQVVAFMNYRSEEKPDVTGKLLGAKNLLANLQSKQKTEKSPPFIPPEDIDPSLLDKKWEEIRDLENKYDVHLQEELKRQNEIRHLAGKFESTRKMVLEWIENKLTTYVEPGIAEISDPENKLLLGSTEAKLQRHEAFVDEKNGMKNRLDLLTELMGKILERHPEHPTVKEHVSEAQKTWSDFENREETLKKLLEEYAAKLREIDGKCVRFGELSDELGLWLDGLLNSLNEPIVAQYVDDVEQFMSDLQEIVNSMGEREKTDMEELKKLDADITAAGIEKNPMARLSLLDVQSKYEAVDVAVDARMKALEDELGVQGENEKMRFSFAEKADKLMSICKEEEEKLNNVSGTLPQRAEVVKNCTERVNEGRKLLEEIEELNRQMVRRRIEENKHTKYTTQQLARALEALLLSAKTKSSNIQGLVSKLQQFHEASDLLLKWEDDKIAMLKKELSDIKNVSVVSVADKKKKQHVAFKEEKNSMAGRYARVEAIASVLNDTEEAHQVTKKKAQVDEKWNEVAELSSSVGDALEKLLSVLQEGDNRKLEFAKTADDLAVWLENMQEKIEEPVVAHSVEDVDKLERELNENANKIEAKKDALSRIEQLDDDSTANPYARHTLDGIKNRWNRVNDSVAERRDALVKEREKQRENETLRADFSKLAEAFIQFCNGVATDAGSMSGTLEAQSKQIAECEAKVSEGREKYREVGAVNEKMKLKEVLWDEKSGISFEDVASAFDQMCSTVSTRRHKVDSLVAKYSKFMAMVDSLNKWCVEKSVEVDSGIGNIPDSLGEIEGLLKKQHTFDEELKTMETKLVSARNLCTELKDIEEYPAVYQKYAELEKSWESLSEKAIRYRELITKEGERLRDLDSKWLQFSRVSEELVLWLEELGKSVNADIIARSVAEIDELMKEHGQLESEFAQRKSNLNVLGDLDTFFVNNGVDSNPYARYTLIEVKRKWEETEKAIVNRKNLLQKEREFHLKNDSYRKMYMEKAGAFVSWCESMSGQVASLSGCLESQRCELDGILEDIINHSDSLKELEDIIDALQSRHAVLTEHGTENKYALSVLRGGYDTLAETAESKMIVISSHIEELEQFLENVDDVVSFCERRKTYIESSSKEPLVALNSVEGKMKVYDSFEEEMKMHERRLQLIDEAVPQLKEFEREDGAVGCVIDYRSIVSEEAKKEIVEEDDDDDWDFTMNESVLQQLKGPPPAAAVQEDQQESSDNEFPTVDEKAESATDVWKVLSSAAEEYKTILVAALEDLRLLDSKCLEFSKKCDELVKWIEGSTDEIRKKSVVSSSKDIFELEKLLVSVRDEMGNRESVYTRIRELDDEIRSRKIVNPYARQTIEEIEKMWASMKELLASKFEIIGSEKERIKKNEELELEIASLLNDFIPWCEKQSNAITAAQSPGELKNQRSVLNKIQLTLDGGKQHLTEIEKKGEEMLERGVKETPHTKYTAEYASERYHSVSVLLTSKIKDVESMISVMVQFRDLATLLSKWEEEKKDMLMKALSTIDSVRSLVVADGLLKKQNSFEDESKSMPSRVVRMSELLEKLVGIQEETNLRQEYFKIKEDLDALTDLSKKYRQKLEHVYEHLKMIDSKSLEFSKKVEDLVAFLENIIQNMSSEIQVSSVAEVEQLRLKFDTSLKEFQQKRSDLEGLESLNNELVKEGVETNVYARFTIIDVRRKWTEADSSLKARQALLSKEARIQKENEDFLEQYVKNAKLFTKWCSECSERIKSVKGEIDVRIPAVDKIREEIMSQKQSLQRLEDLSLKLTDRHIALTGDLQQYGYQKLVNSCESIEAEVRKQREILEEKKRAVKQFTGVVDGLKKWADEKREILLKSIKDVAGVDSLGDATSLLQKHEAFKVEIDAVSSRFSSLDDLRMKLVDIEEFPALEKESGMASKKWEELKQESDRYSQAVKAKIADLQSRDSMYLEFAKKADDLFVWMEDLQRLLNEPVSANSIAEVEELQRAHDISVKSFENRKKDVEELRALESQLKVDGKAANPYGQVSFSDIESKSAIVEKGLKERGDNIANERKEREYDEELRKSLHEKVVKFVEWYDKMNNSVEGCRNEIPAEQLNSLEQLSGSFAEGNDILKEIEDVSQEIGIRKIEPSSDTPFSYQELVEKLERLWSTFKQREELLQTRIRLLEQFRSQMEVVSSWVSTKKNELAQADSPDTSLELVQKQIAKHAALVEEKKSMKQRYAKVLDLSCSLKLALSDDGSVGELPSSEKQKLVALESDWMDIDQMIDEYRSKLENRASVLQELVQLRVKFAKQAQELSIWMDQTLLVLKEPIRASSINDVLQMERDLSSLEGEVTNKGESVEELSRLNEKMCGIEDSVGIPEGEKGNPYSSFGIEFILARWVEISESLSNRKEALGQEKDAQENDEVVRQEFAKKADVFVATCNEISSSIQSVDGDFATQKEKISGHLSDLSTQKELLHELQSLSETLVGRGVVENKHSSHTIQELIVLLQEVSELIRNKLELVETQILAEKQSEVPPEKLREFHQTFDHFDKDDSGSLSKVEMSGCLQSLGHFFTEDELDAFYQEYDNDHDGRISFDEFATFLVSREQAGDSFDEILEAFHVLGEANGISESQLREHLSEEDAGYLLSKLPSKADPRSGERVYNFEQFLQTVFIDE